MHVKRNQCFRIFPKRENKPNPSIAYEQVYERFCDIWCLIRPRDGLDIYSWLSVRREKGVGFTCVQSQKELMFTY